MQTEIARQTSLKGVEAFDKDNLKKAETLEKNPLPDPEGKFPFMAQRQHALEKFQFWALY